MIEKTVVVKSKSGLHARPASFLVKEAGRFQCSLTLGKGGREGDLKSILGVMSLAVMSGETVIIKGDGVDEAEAVEHVVDVFENGLGEDS